MNKQIRVFLGADTPGYTECDEICCSYNALHREMKNGTDIINTFQTWPLDFSKDVKEKYGYEVILMDKTKQTMFEEVI